MVQIELGTHKCVLATNLKVMFKLKDITGLKTLQEAMNAVGKLDMDGQLDFLYAAYNAYKDNLPMTKAEFTDYLLEHAGVFKLTEYIEAVTEGILYNGMSKEEVDEKKELIAKNLPAGMNSSNTDID